MSAARATTGGCHGNYFSFIETVHNLTTHTMYIMRPPCKQACTHVRTVTHNRGRIRFCVAVGSLPPRHHFMCTCSECHYLISFIFRIFTLIRWRHPRNTHMMHPFAFIRKRITMKSNTCVLYNGIIDANMSSPSIYLHFTVY